MVPFIVFEMSGSNPRALNQLLKGDVTKGKHKLTPFIPAIRNLIVRYEQINQAIINYVNNETISNDRLNALNSIPSEILRRTIYDTAAYNKIITAQP